MLGLMRIKSQIHHMLAASFSGIPTKSSNWRSSLDLTRYLKDKKIVCIADLDTRYIASLIRNNGAMNACIIHNKNI